MINFEATLKALSERGVNFVVIGGYAATLHGSAYLTRDLDICYERTPENMERLVSALRPYHPRLRGAPEGLPFLFDVETLSNVMINLAADLGDIDLLGHLSGLGEFPAVALDAISMPLFGGEYRVASLDSLIRSKRAAGRNKDLNVLPELEVLKEMHAQKEQTEPPQD
ncbi:MAG TPA: nucleotidyltransferase [Alphaproteobacteria bacterium]|nr:nucleotidyltransferase [Alphaproteobacteria bacterium]